MFEYLLNDFCLEEKNKIYAYPLWNSEVLSFILKGVIMESWTEGINIVLKGACAEHLFLSMDYFQRLDFVGDKIGNIMS
jgi:hypothetical protein